MQKRLWPDEPKRQELDPLALQEQLAKLSTIVGDIVKSQVQREKPGIEEWEKYVGQFPTLLLGYNAQDMGNKDQVAMGKAAAHKRWLAAAYGLDLGPDVTLREATHRIHMAKEGGAKMRRPVKIGTGQYIPAKPSKNPRKPKVAQVLTRLDNSEIIQLLTEIASRMK